MRTKDFNRSFEQLKPRENRQVTAAINKLRLRVEQGSERYGTWHAELYMPLTAKCKCEPDEAPIVRVQIETRDSKIDDTSYVVGDCHISTGREPLGAPVAYTVDLPFELERAFVGEAMQHLVERAWAAVAALVPAVAAATPPTREEVARTSYGAYIEREGGIKGKRLI